MKVNANIYVDIDGVLCVEVAAGYGDAIELRNADECLDFLVSVATEANRHFGTAMRVFWSVGELNHSAIAEFVNDLARKTLDLPTDCDALPPTFAERHAANDEALAEIRAFVYGEAK